MKVTHKVEVALDVCLGRILYNSIAVEVRSHRRIVNVVESPEAGGRDIS